MSPARNPTPNPSSDAAAPGPGVMGTAGGRALTVLLLLLVVGGAGARTCDELSRMAAGMVREEVVRTSVLETKAAKRRVEVRVRAEFRPRLRLAPPATDAVRIRTVADSTLPPPRAPDGTTR